MRVLIVGCGYVGVPLGADLVQRGHEVFGMRRNLDEVADLCLSGIQPLQGDVTRAETLKDLPGTFDWVINTVSSSKGGLPVYQKVYLEGTRHLLNALKDVRQYLHTSSTSVYAQADGGWVDELSPAEGASPTSRVLVETEQLLLEAAREQQFPAVILRVAGIYGPGRGHLFQQYLREAARLQGEGERWINMIHLDDLVGCMVSALDQAEPGEVYNVVDDLPVTQRDFFQWLSEKLGKPMPPRATEEELQQRKRGVTNKRVSNARMKRSLRETLTFPTFREGYLPELHR